MEADKAHALPLTPIDYVFTGNSAYPVGFVFHYRYRIDAARLHAALAQILLAFRSATYRLEAISTTQYVLSPHQGEVAFSTAAMPSRRAADMPSYDCIDSVQTRENEPLCRIRLTETADGTALGISFSHVVADGFSCFYFLAELAKAFRQEPLSAPELDRGWYQPRPFVLAKPLTSAEAIDLTGFARGRHRQDIPQSDVAWEHIHVSEAEVAGLMAEASAQTACRLSRNDVLTAYLWKKYVPQWLGSQTAEDASFCLPFDVRRFSHWVSPRHFGNGICLAGAHLPYKRFSAASLGELAALVRATVDKVTEDYARTAYDVFGATREREGLAAMGEFHVSDQCSGILVTNLSRVPLESVDFGAGAPFSFATVADAPRAAIVLPAADGFQIDVCLPRAG
ncbi:MAG: acyltransferase [Betaproteobacteria bacterium]